MSSPLVAGGAAVVRDYYQKAHSHGASAALVKATLINSAADLLDENNDGIFDNALPIPNMHEGWGRVDLANATDGSHQFDDETSPLATGTNATFNFPMPTPGLPFRVTVVWTDYPSTAASAVNLVNDLDLTVTAPDGTTYLGNVFSGGWSTAGGSADRVNNVENVYVFAAAAGTWTVTVNGYNVPNGPQRFALVVDSGAGGGSGLPIVRVAASDATATEAPLTTGGFRITRSGDLAGDLTVTYTVSGMATAGSDYVALSGTATIPDGLAEVIVTVTPIDDPDIEPSETVVVTAAADAAYTVGSPSSAVVSLTSNDLPPDLVVTTVTAPQFAAVGGIMSVTDATRNAGTAPAGASETFFYFSTNSLLEEVDFFIGSRPVPPLGAGVTDLATTPLTVPATTPPGLYYVIAAADWSEMVTETVENNQTRVSGLVRVGPDLLVTVLTAPATAAAGEPLTVNDTTKNSGAGTAPATVTAFFLSTNTTWDTGDVLLGSRPVPRRWRAVRQGGGGDAADRADHDRRRHLLHPGQGRQQSGGAGIAGEQQRQVQWHGQGRRRPDDDGDHRARRRRGRRHRHGQPRRRRTPAAATRRHRPRRSISRLNSALDAADLMIGTASGGGARSGYVGAVRRPLTIPARTLVGTYYILAKADGPGEVAETSESTTRAPAARSRWARPDRPHAGRPLAGRRRRGAERHRNGEEHRRRAVDAERERVLPVHQQRLLDAADVELGRRPVFRRCVRRGRRGGSALLVPASTVAGELLHPAKVDPDEPLPEVYETNNLK